MAKKQQGTGTSAYDNPTEHQTGGQGESPRGQSPQFFPLYPATVGFCGKVYNVISQVT